VARKSQKRRKVLTTDRVSILQLASGAARAVLLPSLGGSIGAFTVKDRPILRATPDEALTDANVRLASCYPLVPYSNRIRDARLSFNGQTFPLTRNFGDSPHSIHGVGWQRPWRIEAATPTRATLALEHTASDDAAPAWPWSFCARQTFDLAGDEVHACLTMTLTIANAGDSAFPYGLGWHPFFPRDPTTTLQFGATSVWRNDVTELPVERIAAQSAWSFRDPAPLGDATIDNVFVGWDGRATVRSAPDTSVTVDADSACACLVVYAPAGRDFLAIEPVTHETDAFNRAAAGAQHTGIRVLAPGAAYSCTMRIAASIARSP
jgi:aldose 1-epimerase